MASVETCHASVRLIHAINEQHGIHSGLTEALETIFARASSAGRSSDDVSSVYQTMKR
jgi:3-hydroxyisobutyrate dehydrogenase-like beta-hydroxyacid dehydrogenase